jgi:hypothetical protein
MVSRGMAEGRMLQPVLLLKPFQGLLNVLHQLFTVFLSLVFAQS